MSPKRRESPERTKTSKATTRPEVLMELAEAIEDACLAPREIRMPQRLALGDNPGADDPTYKAAAERYERDREAARGRVAAATRRLLAARRDALPDLEEQEAREIEAAVDCMELQVVDPYEGYRETRFDLCAPRIKEIAALLRVRAEKMRANTPPPLEPGRKWNRLELIQLPNGKQPAVFRFKSVSYTVPSGKAWDAVRTLIEKDAFDSHGHEIPAPGQHFRRKHRRFFSERMTHNESGWYIKTK